MAQPDIIVTEDNKVQLTKAETDYLQSFLSAGDRGGFYLAYYNMTGSAQALEQGEITTFSGEVGGTAYAANLMLQTYFAPESKYAGIYYLSQRVANNALLEIGDNIAGGGSGVIKQ
jgi:hypothetical protein